MIIKTLKAFTLLEVMIAVAIVGILGAIAYPSYVSYYSRTRRAEAKAALVSLSARMEAYYSRNNTYVGATLANTNTASTTENGFYTIAISTATATAYTITATPGGVQASDACGTFSLNQLGTRTVSGSESATTCWG